MLWKKSLKMHHADLQEELLQRVADVQHTYEHLGGYEMKARAEAALSGVGLKERDFNNPFQ